MVQQKQKESHVVIPLHGKMGFRTFHRPSFIESLKKASLNPFYLIDQVNLQSHSLNSQFYGDLLVEQSEELLRNNNLLSELVQLRRFVVKTETTDLRLRETLEGKLFNKVQLIRVLLYGLQVDILRHVPGMGKLAIIVEEILTRKMFYSDFFSKKNIKCVLVPGLGNWGFWSELVLAREAQRKGLHTIAAITNYDNLVNRGFRGFMPDKLAVWSTLMADEAMKLHSIPAKRIEVTGPVQFDPYFEDVSVSRDVFLTSIGLDPKKKTILYAGGVNVRRYFDIFYVVKQLMAVNDDCNVIIRAYPHEKVLLSPEWQLLEKEFNHSSNVYISNALTTSADTIGMSQNTDIVGENDFDELTCLLKFSDVMINHYSTIALEAAICDLPTIQIAYDVSIYGLKYNNTAAYQKRQTHNLRIKRIKGARIANNKNELLAHLESYLADKTLDQEKRYEYALSECNYLDGRSGERLIKLIERDS